MTAIQMCRFGDKPAVAVYEMSRGCACFPEDRRQALCEQHAVNAEPLGSMELIEDLTPGKTWSDFWRAG